MWFLENTDLRLNFDFSYTFRKENTRADKIT